MEQLRELPAAEGVSAFGEAPEKNRRKRKKYRYVAYLWLLPAAALMLVFCYYPPIQSLILSFTNGGFDSMGTFVGFDNYLRLFTDAVFWKSMGNVLILTAFGLVAGNVMTILLAELLYNCVLKKVAAVYRFLFILPILVPGVVMTLIWQHIVFSGGSTGLANTLIGWFGIAPQNWYFGENTALLSIMLTSFPWVGGTSFLIYLAGLQSIPQEVCEAGRLDGLGTFRRVFTVDFPFLAGQIKYFVILGIIGGVQNFNMQLLVTGSGPGTSNATNVPGYYLYENAFIYGDFGLGAAMGMVIFIVTLGLTILNMRKMRSTEEVME